MRPLAGGNEQYLDTLAWVVEQCLDEGCEFELLRQRYAARFGLNLDVAYDHLTALRRYELLEDRHGRRVATAPSARWLQGRQAALVIGTMHANVRFIGELLELAREPCSKLSLLRLANNCYDLNWKQPGPIDFRLCWLRSAGFVRMLDNNEYQATQAGTAFLELIDLHRPITESTTDEPRQPISDDEPFPPKPPKIDTTPPSTSLSPSATADEIAQRLVVLSCDGAKHKEFEVAVRDAFDFLGFQTHLLSGAGQTDVVVSGVRKTEVADNRSTNRWQYRAVVDAKAVSKGSLTSGQVTWPAIEKHRDQHQADYALLVGPSPSGQLLDFAAKAQIGVLAAEHLADLVGAHGAVPLPLKDYQSIFVDENGRPRGGTIELQPIEATRSQQARRRDLLLAVHQAVTDVAGKGLRADQSAISVTLNMMKGIQASPSEVIAAVELLAGEWLGALARSDDGEAALGGFLPTAPARIIAQRLRWLADAFDGETDDSASSAGSG